MYSSVVRFSKVMVLGTALLAGVVAMALCWAVLFLGFLLLVGLSRITPGRWRGCAGDASECVESARRELAAETERSTA